MRSLYFVVAVIVGLGCQSNVQEANPGNPALGIARFVTHKSPHLTTIVGLNAKHHVVAHIELVHGQFVLGEGYLELAGTKADGRKLTATIRGRHFEWETVGYTDTTKMPPLPEELHSFTTLFA